jgi:hypothetical protein
MKLVSESRASLSIGDIREPGGRVSLLGTLKTARHMSRKALEMEHLSLFVENP